MSSTATVFTHSIGRKVVMGLTGLFLVTFLFVHVGGNSLLFIPDDGRTFNAFVKFMTTNPLIKGLELVLAAGFIFHIIYAFILTAKNNAARPVKYAFKGAKDKGSSWVSRNMIWTGGIVLLFLLLHIPMFYGTYHFNKTGNGTVTLQKAFEDNWKVKEEVAVNGVTIVKKDSYVGTDEMLFVQANDLQNKEVKALSMTQIVKESFSNPLMAGFYVICMVFLSLHLMHGFQSGFRTLGLVHKKYTPLIKFAGIVIAGVIPFLFALMPIVYYIRETMM
ncbi:MAG: succinate dehydrogenase cytochrome b subunit [Bacteroidota bacterium]